MRKLIYIIALLIASQINSFGQWCCIDTNLIIKDKATTTLRFQIVGATNNDLSTPTQGLCGVRIKFKHKSIGDVTMSLISPGGQKVDLLGPNANARRTDLTNWNVSFVPCAVTAVPDVGFKQKWDNVQNWGILGQFYNGTYYPFNGCLEDFNLGAVNGIWTLTIVDSDLFYDGLVESFCLLFCDDSGVSCNSCSSNGGYFNLAPIMLCESNDNLNLDVKPTIPSFTPDPLNYGYKYFVFLNNILIDVKDNLDFRSYSSGNYTICGLSYLLSDFSKLPSISSAISFNDFRNNLITNRYNACAEFSKDCLNLVIGKASPIIDVTNTICKGDTFKINGSSYYTDGTYILKYTNITGCDSTVNLNLKTIEVKAIIQNPIPSLSCTTKSVIIDASASKIGANTQIYWETNGGYFEDLSNKLMPVITRAGRFKLVLTDGNCKDSIEFDVQNTSVLPTINIVGDTITCKKPTVELTVSSNVNSPIIEWTFGNQVIGVSDKISVSQPGDYIVQVTDSKGCSNFQSYKVIENKILPQFELNATEITCQNDTSILSFSTTENYSSFFWTGVNFQSFDLAPKVTKPGEYEFKMEGSNGCVETKKIVVNSSVVLPVVRLSADSITCNNRSIKISNAYTGNYKFNWSGPSMFTSNSSEPDVTIAGRYTLMIEDEHGCKRDTFIDILENTIPPNYTLNAGMLGCNPDSIQIILNFNNATNASEYSYTWSGPIGFGSSSQSPWTREEGFYTVRVVGLNGCISMDTITVIQRIEKPKIALNANELSCIDSAVALQIVSSNIASYNTTGPNNFVSTDPIPLVTSPGIYRVIVTDNNGCTAEKSIIINENRTPPFDVLAAETKTCIRDSVILSFTSSSTIDTILWTGPSGFSSSLAMPKVFEPGLYILQANGRNGCALVDSVVVVFDTIKPLIQITVDTLSCKQPEFTLQKSANIIIDKYIWTSPAGQIDTSLNYVIDAPGNYQLRAIGVNGCESITTFDVVQISTKPQVSLKTDTITCTKPIVDIIVNTNDNRLFYSWNGPNNFISGLQNIQVSEPGKYYVNVENRFGCTINDSIEIFSSVKIPKLSFSTSNFNCSNFDRNTIVATPSYPRINIEWTLPNNTVIIADSIKVFEAGLYIIKTVDQNQCMLLDSLVVTIDTVKPIIDLATSDTLDCFDTKLVLFAESSDAQSFLWTSQAGFTSNLPNPIIDKEDIYTVEVTAKNFCKSTKTITILSDQKIPVIDAIAKNIDCINIRGFLDVNTTDSIKSFSWSTPTNTLVTSRSFATLDTGLYILVVEGLNKCLATDTARIIIDTIPPQVTATYELFPCNADSTQLFANSNSKIKDYIWLGPNRFFSTEATPSIRDTGLYTLTVLGDNNCPSNSTIHVDGKKDYPSLLLSGGTISCINDTIQIFAIFDSKDSLIAWTGPSNYYNGKDRNPMISIPGIYAASIMNKKGCQVDSTILILVDTVAPIIQIKQLDSLKCENNSIRLNSTISNVNNVSFQWTASSSTQFNSSINASQVIVNSEGVYVLRVTNLANGCESSNSIQVIEDRNVISGVDLDVYQISCSKNSDASISLKDVMGGQSPFYISTDGINFNPNTTINQLKPGNYKVYFKDKNGCKYDTLIQINEGFLLNLYLGRDTTIQLGESYTINPQTNADTNVVNFEWLPRSEIKCNDCFSQNVSPFQSTLYKLRVTDQNGCTAEDEIYIKVNTKPKFFLPNAFSPNGDRLNDKISISVGVEIAEINEFTIYDRWGNLIYREEDIPLGQESFIDWDGTFGGEICLPGVYVYKIKATLISGKVHQLVGDITLLR